MQLKVKRLHPYAVIPTYATDGSACFDLTAISREKSFNTCLYQTGLAFEIPKGYVMLIYSRSGHGFNKDIRLANCVGVVDSDYTGDVMVKLTFDDDGLPEFPEVGDRVAQAMIMPIPRAELIETDTLHETERGSNGFGSTGR